MATDLQGSIACNLACFRSGKNGTKASIRRDGVLPLTDQARQAQDQGVISVIGSNCGSTRAMMNAFYCLDVQYCEAEF